MNTKALVALFFVAVVVTLASAAKVEVKLCYESYCPGCKEIITKDLGPIFNEPGYNDYCDTVFVPYGNTKEHWHSIEKKWTFTCQHGRSECEVDIFESCGLYLHNGTTDVWFPYINCIETEPSLSRPKYCAEQSGWDYGPIKDCYDGDLGWQVEHTMATITPDHDYSPWLTINGQHERWYEDMPLKARYVTRDGLAQHRRSAAPLTAAYRLFATRSPTRSQTGVRVVLLWMTVFAVVLNSMELQLNFNSHNLN